MATKKTSKNEVQQLAEIVAKLVKDVAVVERNLDLQGDQILYAVNRISNAEDAIKHRMTEGNRVSGRGVATIIRRIDESNKARADVAYAPQDDLKDAGVPNISNDGGRIKQECSNCRNYGFVTACKECSRHYSDLWKAK